jgi:hypothetical protein
VQLKRKVAILSAAASGIGDEESGNEGHVIPNDHSMIGHSGDTVWNQLSLPIPNDFWHTETFHSSVDLSN